MYKCFYPLLINDVTYPQVSNRSYGTQLGYMPREYLVEIRFLANV